MCSASDTQWEGCEWNVSRTRANVVGKAAAAAGGAVTCSWQLFAQSQTSSFLPSFFFLILYFPPTLQPQKSMTPNPLQTLWHTKTPAIQQQHLINAFSFSLFLLSFLFFWEEKPSIHRENGGTPNYMEWIGHPSPEASVANRFETPPPSYITAAHHLPNNFQYYLPMPRIETQSLSRRHSCYIKPTYFHRFINLKSKI